WRRRCGRRVAPWTCSALCSLGRWATPYWAWRPARRWRTSTISNARDESAARGTGTARIGGAFRRQANERTYSDPSGGRRPDGRLRPRRQEERHLASNVYGARRCDGEGEDRRRRPRHPVPKRGRFLLGGQRYRRLHFPGPDRRRSGRDGGVPLPEGAGRSGQTCRGGGALPGGGDRPDAAAALRHGGGGRRRPVVRAVRQSGAGAGGGVVAVAAARAGASA